jgi:hypothetical protein
MSYIIIIIRNTSGCLALNFVRKLRAFWRSEVLYIFKYYWRRDLQFWNKDTVRSQSPKWSLCSRSLEGKVSTLKKFLVYVIIIQLRQIISQTSITLSIEHSIVFSLLFYGEEYVGKGRHCFVRLLVNNTKEYQMSFEISGGILQNRWCRKEVKDMKKRDKKNTNRPVGSTADIVSNSRLSEEQLNYYTEVWQHSSFILNFFFSFSAALRSLCVFREMPRGAKN